MLAGTVIYSGGWGQGWQSGLQGPTPGYESQSLCLSFLICHT